MPFLGTITLEFCDTATDDASKDAVMEAARRTPRATAYSIAAGLPLLALSFLMLAPLFIWFAPDMTRKELTDFVGEKVA